MHGIAGQVVRILLKSIIVDFPIVQVITLSQSVIMDMSSAIDIVVTRIHENVKNNQFVILCEFGLRILWFYNKFIHFIQSFFLKRNNAHRTHQQRVSSFWRSF